VARVPGVFEGHTDAFPDVQEQVPVGVDRGLDVGVTEVFHDLVLLCALPDEQRREVWRRSWNRKVDVLAPPSMPAGRSIVGSSARSDSSSTTGLRRFGITARHVRWLVAQRRIPFVKWGHLLRFDPSEIEAWMNGSRRPPAA
jgi:excisionase family DNA binding protein